jgi:glutamate-ammonia-ligase adenylyltransferase
LIQYPALAERLFQSDYLYQQKPYARFLEELLAMTEAEWDDTTTVAQAVRNYRYEETLRLTVRETASLGGFAELGQERSDLAAACTEVAFRVLNQKLSRELGLPVESQRGIPSEFSILGMGKLGGGDLNHSSDIDLIYFYSSDGGDFQGGGSSQKMTHHEYFVRLGELLTRFLSERTQDGFVYRVDLDLRPEGQKGTLANSVDAMEVYYESFGDNWERMALTKARPIAGDLSLGEDLLRRVQAFVYPRVSDFSTLEQIRDLKNRIEQSLHERVSSGIDPQGPGYNVKLGIGGIREIEFFVGAFQRLYAGRDTALQDRNTLSALSRLVSQGIVSEEDGQQLDKAYRFLRTAENHLQMLEERQTHSLPKAKDELEAFAINIESSCEVSNFFSRLSVHTEHVRKS